MAPSIPGFDAHATEATPLRKRSEAEDGPPSRTRDKKNKKRANRGDDDAGRDSEAEDGKVKQKGPLKDMLREDRLRRNPSNILYYEDGKYSKGKFMVDWPGVCRKYGWDAGQLCGPVVMSGNTVKGREYDCMDATHR
jgi:hypothetical protein